MENASKALIMAGAVLIAIMIISLGIIMFNNFSSSAKKMANMDEQEITAFNSKIAPYIGESISASQVNALLQYSLSVNMSAQNAGEDYKCISVKDTKNNKDLINMVDGKYISCNRVQTGSSVFYTVKAKANDYGLLTDIEVKEN